MITLERLTSLLAQFPRLTVGLIGDLFLDRYLEIPAGPRETSIETGLEAYQVTRVRNIPGALGTVMNNLAALGAGTLRPVTVIGDDGHGYDLLQSLSALPVDTAHVLRCASRLTPTYTKPLRQSGDGVWQELHRLDVRTRAPLDAETVGQVCRHVDEVASSSDGLIVLDQISEENHGVVPHAVRAHLAEISRAQPRKLIYIDSLRVSGPVSVRHAERQPGGDPGGGRRTVQRRASGPDVGRSHRPAGILHGRRRRMPGGPAQRRDIAGSGFSRQRPGGHRRCRRQCHQRHRAVPVGRRDRSRSGRRRQSGRLNHCPANRHHRHRHAPAADRPVAGNARRGDGIVEEWRRRRMKQPGRVIPVVLDRLTRSRRRVCRCPPAPAATG